MISILNDLKNEFFDLSLLRDGHFVELLDDEDIFHLSNWQIEIELSIFEAFFIDYKEENYKLILERVISDIDLPIVEERERPNIFELRNRATDSSKFVNSLLSKYLELYNSIDHFNERGFRRVFYNAPVGLKIKNYNFRVGYTFNHEFVDALDSIEKLGLYYLKILLTNNLTTVGREIDTYDGNELDEFLKIYEERNNDIKIVNYVKNLVNHISEMR